VKLAKPITTRSRAKTTALDFIDRNSSVYSGEWTDAKRLYFVLEPPRPPPPEPDMDAIREGRNAAAGLPALIRPGPSARATPYIGAEGNHERSRGKNDVPNSVVRQFEASMSIDYEKWHDGIGYDLTLLKEAKAADLKAIEAMLIGHADRDWRDVEALATLNTPAARRALKRVMTHGNAEIRAAVMRYASALVPKAQRMVALIQALKTAEFYGGLSQALDDVEDFHPPEIVAELFRGVLNRKGDVAIHFAAMLMFIHGKANSPFDWNHRPFFLRFDTTSRAAREALFRELCAKVNVDPNEYLAAR
jgi:hypothetical protein